MIPGTSGNSNHQSHIIEVFIMQLPRKAYSNGLR
jgi:hypothetical protein